MGWVEGQNLVIEERWMMGDAQRAGDIAANLVDLNPDVLVASSSTQVEALRRITKTIPIIFVLHADPVGVGHVASLARPGGNITGLSQLMTDVSEDITLEQWDAAFDSQAKAFLVGVREAVSLMGKGGRILAITYAEGSRTGGLQPWVGMGSAKAALESLVRYFAVTLAKRGITVNAISPGWTEDSVLNSLPQQAQDLIRNWHARGWTPMGRLGTPEDVGNVATLFCSEQAGWITGQVIYADGGASLMNPEVPTEIQIG